MAAIRRNNMKHDAINACRPVVACFIGRIYTYPPPPPPRRRRLRRRRCRRFCGNSWIHVCNSLGACNIVKRFESVLTTRNALDGKNKTGTKDDIYTMRIITHTHTCIHIIKSVRVMIRPRLTIELRIHKHTWSPHYHSGTFFARPVRYYARAAH